LCVSIGKIISRITSGVYYVRLMRLLRYMSDERKPRGLALRYVTKNNYKIEILDKLILMIIML